MVLQTIDELYVVLRYRKVRTDGWVKIVFKIPVRVVVNCVRRLRGDKRGVSVFALLQFYRILSLWGVLKCQCNIPLNGTLNITIPRNWRIQEISCSKTAREQQRELGFDSHCLSLEDHRLGGLSGEARFSLYYRF